MDSKDPEFWFTPKKHGYGATPTHWKGWLATAAFAIALPAVSLPFLLSLTEETRTAGIMLWAGAVLWAVWQFTAFAKRKTDGEWLWRWKGVAYRSMLDDLGKTGDGGGDGKGSDKS